MQKQTSVSVEFIAAMNEEVKQMSHFLNVNLLFKNDWKYHTLKSQQSTLEIIFFNSTLTNRNEINLDDILDL